MTFAEKVKYARLKLYMSQETFAKEIGVSFATVNRWESKELPPRLVSQKLFYDYCDKKKIKFED